uniref:Uncharacterized protein n=1 Tax=Globodera rostochiensis TaxID=31243 RepID=A0A914I960_GLORO
MVPNRPKFGAQSSKIWFPIVRMVSNSPKFDAQLSEIWDLRLARLWVLRSWPSFTTSSCPSCWARLLGPYNGYEPNVDPSVSNDFIFWIRGKQYSRLSANERPILAAPISAR